MAAGKFTRGDTIYWEGDLGKEMYIITKGRVSLIREMGDGEIPLAKLGIKEFFGEMALFGESKRKFSARAIDDCELLVINNSILQAQFRKVPEWLVVMMKTIAKRITATEKGIKARFKIGIDYSVLKTIYLLSQDFGTKEEKGISLPIDQVRTELFEVLGVSYDDIDNWLKKFNFVNLIKILSSKNQLFIPDQNRIKSFADFLCMKSPGGKNFNFDQNTLFAFERIYKLLAR